MPIRDDDGVGVSGPEGTDGELEPERNLPAEPERTLIPHDALKRELALASDTESLKQLGDKVAGIQEFARRAKFALEELIRLSETRLRVARKLGEILRETVRRGGKSKSHRVTSTWGGSSAPLPEDIPKMQSFRLQSFADIPDEHFERYMTERWDRKEIMTFAGCRRSARRYASGPDEAARPATTAKAYWDRVWDAVTRVMDIDLFVGSVPAEAVGASTSLKPREAIESHLSGNVLVRTNKDIARWLTQLAKARQCGKVVEAMILFPPRMGHGWILLLESGRWICCFLEKPESMSAAHALAYLGDRKHGFWIAFRELGSVLAAAYST